MLCTACSNSPKEKGTPIRQNTKNAQSVAQREPDGIPYSDSMVNAIVNEIIENSKPVIIDTARDLHSFVTQNFKMSSCNKFTIDTINKYSTIDEPVTKAQAKLLRITDYFADKTYTKNFNTYIFYAKSTESHFGNFFVLYTIDKKSNKIARLLLSQEYLYEGYESKIESTFIKPNRIKVKKTEFFNTSNLDKTDDSISVSNAIFFISKNGEIKEMISRRSHKQLQPK